MLSSRQGSQKMNRGTGLRIDTDGANESHMLSTQGNPNQLRNQVDTMDPFALIAATTGVNISNNLNGMNGMNENKDANGANGANGINGINGISGANGYGWATPMTPLTPTTPLPITVADFINIAESLKALMAETAGLRAESAGLRGMVKDLNIKIEEEKSKNRLVHRYPDANVNAAPATPGSKVQQGPPVTPPAQRTALLEPFPITPAVPTIPSNPHTPAVTTIPSTPHTQGTRSGGVHASTGRRTGGSTRGRHRRTHTPTQTNIRGMTSGPPLHTMGIDPQDDRGLLRDFFEDVVKWAQHWTVTSQIISPQHVSELCSPGSVVFEFLGNGDGVGILGDDSYRGQLVAAIVSFDIAYHTLCENFLHLSGFPEAAQADILFNEYNRLGDGNESAKHELLMQQKALYTAIKEQPHHRRLRSSKAKDLAATMVFKLGHLLRDAPAAAFTDATDRDLALQDLYVRGYRIGFRMRMEAAKWAMSWPCVGEEFNGALMVNVSRNLHGDPIQTMQRIQLAPGNYAVRFAMSPSITKSVFTTGQEEKTIVYKGMTHLVCKANHIGAERSFFGTGPRH